MRKDSIERTESTGSGWKKAKERIVSMTGPSKASKIAQVMSLTISL